MVSLLARSSTTNSASLVAARSQQVVTAVDSLNKDQRDCVLTHHFFKFSKAKFTLPIFGFQVVYSLLLNRVGVLHFGSLFCLIVDLLQLSLFY